LIKKLAHEDFNEWFRIWPKIELEILIGREFGVKPYLSWIWSKLWFSTCMDGHEFGSMPI
jgi:hypothetical protein